MEMNRVILRIVGNKTEAKCYIIGAAGQVVTYYGWGRNGVEAANKITKDIRKDMGRNIRLSFEGMRTSWTT